MCRTNKEKQRWGFTPFEIRRWKRLFYFRQGFRTGPVRKKFSNGVGFTLIETLLVAAMFSVVAIAIYSTFNSGIKIWQRLTQDVSDEELNIFIEKISSDLRNSFGFSGIEFVGEKDAVTFATLVMTQNDGQKEKFFSVGQVGYSFDVQSERLNRWQADYRELHQNKSFLLRVMMNNVKSLSFQYYYDAGEENYIWADVWQQVDDEEEKKFPLAVRIRIEFDEDAESKTVTRTITIPVGG